MDRTSDMAGLMYRYASSGPDLGRHLNRSPEAGPHSQWQPSAARLAQSLEPPATARSAVRCSSPGPDGSLRNPQKQRSYLSGWDPRPTRRIDFDGTVTSAWQRSYSHLSPRHGETNKLYRGN